MREEGGAGAWGQRWEEVLVPGGGARGRSFGVAAEEEEGAQGVGGGLRRKEARRLTREARRRCAWTGWEARLRRRRRGRSAPRAVALRVRRRDGW